MVARGAKARKQGTKPASLCYHINCPHLAPTLCARAGASAIKNLQEGAAEYGTTFAGLVTGDLRGLPPLPPSVLDPLLMQLGATGELPEAALKLTPSECGETRGRGR